MIRCVIMNNIEDYKHFHFTNFDCKKITYFYRLNDRSICNEIDKFENMLDNDIKHKYNYELKSAKIKLVKQLKKYLIIDCANWRLYDNPLGFINHSRIKFVNTVYPEYKQEYNKMFSIFSKLYYGNYDILLQKIDELSSHGSILQTKN